MVYAGAFSAIRSASSPQDHTRARALHAHPPPGFQSYPQELRVSMGGTCFFYDPHRLSVAPPSVPITVGATLT